MKTIAMMPRSTHVPNESIRCCGSRKSGPRAATGPAAESAVVISMRPAYGAVGGRPVTRMP